MKFNRHFLGDCRQELRRMFSYFLFGLGDTAQKNKELIQSLKNKYAGRRAFVVCNGPSLSAKDLDTIAENGDLSIACNKIDKIFSRTKWRPTFYALMDQGYQYKLKDTMNAMPSELKVFRQESYYYTKNVAGKCIYVDTRVPDSTIYHPGFFEDITEHLAAVSTVTYSMFQILVHLGIREMYIIGCDNSYNKEMLKDGTIIERGIASYFEGAESKDNQIVGTTWQNTETFRYAREYADTHGIQIKNATRGGFLEVFERVEFDSLFNNIKA